MDDAMISLERSPQGSVVMGTQPRGSPVGFFREEF
jgi:hypothetical protein